MNSSELDAVLQALPARKARTSRRPSSVTASAPLLRKVPAIPGSRPKPSLTDDTTPNEIRRLKQQLYRMQKANRQLQNAVSFRDAKLSKKELEVEAALQEKSPMFAKLSQEKARVRTYRDKLRRLKSEAALSSEQFEELRQKCRFSQLEELRVQVDEFYAEIVRLRAMRQSDIVYVVKSAKALEADLEQQSGVRQSLKKWLRTVADLPCRASMEYIVDCRHRILHESGIDSLPDRNEFAKHLRRARNAIEKAPSMIVR